MQLGRISEKSLLAYRHCDLQRECSRDKQTDQLTNRETGRVASSQTQTMIVALCKGVNQWHGLFSIHKWLPENVDINKGL